MVLSLGRVSDTPLPWSPLRLCVTMRMLRFLPPEQMKAGEMFGALTVCHAALEVTCNFFKRKCRHRRLLECSRGSGKHAGRLPSQRGRLRLLTSLRPSFPIRWASDGDTARHQPISEALCPTLY